jgi:hypothetical protein
MERTALPRRPRRRSGGLATKQIIITSDDPEGSRDRGLFAVTVWEITSPEFHGIVYTQAFALDKLAALPRVRDPRCDPVADAPA